MVESIYQQIGGEAAMNAAAAGHLQDTLKELGVPESIAGEIMPSFYPRPRVYPSVVEYPSPRKLPLD